MRSLSPLVLLATLLMVGSASPERASAQGQRKAAAARISAGRFILSGTARADVTVMPARDYPLDVLVLVSPGVEPGTVRLHLRSRGHACELRARLGKGTVLELAPGQTCSIEPQGEQRGQISAQLRSGTGRLTEQELSLDLAWQVSGSITAAEGSTVTIPGTSVDFEMPLIPVRGTVEARASGPREAPADRAARRQ